MHVEIYTLSDEGKNSLAGTLRLDGDTIKPDGDTDLLEGILARPVVVPSERQIYTANANPEAFLTALHEQYTSAYLRASKPIEEGGRGERVEKSWDETKHPRGQPENAGEFAPKEGGEEEQPPSYEESMRKYREWQERSDKLDEMRRELTPPSRPETDDEIQAVATYREQTGKFIELMLQGAADENLAVKAHLVCLQILKHMSIGAQGRMRNNLGDFVLYDNTDELTKKSGIKSGVCGGFFAFNRGDRTGTLHIDGGWPDQPGSTREIYAHEFGHVIDGVGSSFSRDEQWVSAWEKEIAPEHAPLSEYARTNPSEGFAEYARLLLTGRYVEARKEFPSCWAFWKNKGLL